MEKDPGVAKVYVCIYICMHVCACVCTGVSVGTIKFSERGMVPEQNVKTEKRGIEARGGEVPNFVCASCCMYVGVQ